jgi:hypothetical protein
MLFSLHSRSIIATTLGALTLGACTDATSPRSVPPREDRSPTMSGSAATAATNWVVRL